MRGSIQTKWLAFTLSAGLLLTACSDEGPTAGPTVTVSAPTLVSPAGGSQSSSNQPTLTLTNVTVSDGSVPTYSFQVASDTAFASIVAQTSGIAQGTGGQTSWQVSVALDNRDYYWRARARAGTTDGPFSGAAHFTVASAGFSSGSGPLAVSDPLTNGTTVGEQHGGEFVTGGWRVNSLSDYIRYEVHPSISSGFLEWQNSGLRVQNANIDAYMLIAMWDPTEGNYRTNPFRVHLQKRDANHLPPFLRLRWISEADQIEPAYHKADWDPNHTYQWRLEWGPEQGTEIVRLILDGAEIMVDDYNWSYDPTTHWIELGVNEERNESCINAVYSNVRIGRK